MTGRSDAFVTEFDLDAEAPTDGPNVAAAEGLACHAYVRGHSSPVGSTRRMQHGGQQQPDLLLDAGGMLHNHTELLRHDESKGWQPPPLRLVSGS